ncbi:hypothetical protein QLX67_06215 [Balneolaceae bacterium ANBcel3]|nr:hypothetical protein [Balneolaceae bacterium ANBcel3]
MLDCTGFDEQHALYVMYRAGKGALLTEKEPPECAICIQREAVDESYTCHRTKRMVHFSLRWPLVCKKHTDFYIRPLFKPF